MPRLAWLLGFVTLVGACSSPNLENTNFHCDTDADCGAGKICGRVDGVPACVSAQSSPIRIGMSAPLQGPSEDLGIEMRRGIQAYFERANDEGGAFGRPIELDCLNDNYDPGQALANVRQLLDVRQEVSDPDLPDIVGGNGVLALLGNVGTPPMLATAPVATKNRVVFFAPFTGAQRYLRDGTNSPFVYNYRAGYYEETEAMIDYLAGYRAPRIITRPDSYTRILAFTQNDSYGDAGYAGLVNAYNTRIAAVPQPDSTAPNPSIVRFTYERENVSSVDPAIAQAATHLSGLLAESGAPVSVAIVMVDTYQPGNKFTRALRDWQNEDAERANRLDLLFMHVSFVGSDSLAKALASAPETYLDATDPGGTRRIPYTQGVIVTQVVPYYGAQAPAVSAYRSDLRAFDGGENTFTSLEGYIAARLFVEALKLNGPNLDSESLVRTLDTRMTDIDIGIGTRLSFSSTNHQASHTVWGSVIEPDGSFSVPFIWNPTDGIVPQ